MPRTDNSGMTSSFSASSSVGPGEPGSGTTPNQPEVPSVSEVISGAEPSPVPPTEESKVAADTAPTLPAPEQAEVAQNDPDSPSVKDESAKLAGAAKAKDDKARAENPNVPIIRDGDPKVGGEHFL